MTESDSRWLRCSGRKDMPALLENQTVEAISKPANVVLLWIHQNSVFRHLTHCEIVVRQNSNVSYVVHESSSLRLTFEFTINFTTKSRSPILKRHLPTWMIVTSHLIRSKTEKNPINLVSEASSDDFFLCNSPNWMWPFIRPPILYHSSITSVWWNSIKNQNKKCSNKMKILIILLLLVTFYLLYINMKPIFLVD